MQKKEDFVLRLKKMSYLCLAFDKQSSGRLAQLVQSICLTSRGSAVRIRQRPLYTESLQNISVRIFFFVLYLIQWCINSSYFLKENKGKFGGKVIYFFTLLHQ